MNFSAFCGSPAAAAGPGRGAGWRRAGSPGLQRAVGGLLPLHRQAEGGGADRGSDPRQERRRGRSSSSGPRPASALCQSATILPAPAGEREALTER